MATVPIQVLTCVDRLSANGDFAMLIDYLHAERVRNIEQLLVTTNTVSVHQLQGYSQALTDILQLVTTAKDVLTNLG